MSAGPVNETVPIFGKTKFVACRKCHARKVKCPGGQPCKTCVQLDCPSECVYPKRDRQIRVSESHINSILQQNQALRARLQSIQNTEDASKTQPRSPTQENGPPQHGEPSHNPLLGDTPWFVHLPSFNVPLRVGEGADTAFATRFRQAISPHARHPPRLQYPNEALIMSFLEMAIQPSSTQARFLVQAALANIDQSYHIVRKSSVWALLDRFLEASTKLDLLAKCKIYALFGLGELYSSHYKAPESNLPGLAYFGIAFKAHGYLLERPCVDSIEITLLLSIYSLCINRWHSAYFLANSAIRHCANMGLHFNIPEAHLPDRAAREHLCRLWWTSYVLEHTCAVNSWQLVLIQEDEILVDLPSNARLSDAQQSDFTDADCICATIKLARLSRSIINDIYGRGKHSASFLTRVQRGLRDLKEWFKTLPDHLKLNSEEGSLRPERFKTLHLLFNQCMILTTRPLLLHLVRSHGKSKPTEAPSASSQIKVVISTLVQACVRSARQSYAILTESWISGSFKPFDYTRTQYLFSAATILAISGFLDGIDGSRDRDDFGMAFKLMQDLVKSGSVAAAEFHQHLEAIKVDIRNHSAENRMSETRNDQRPEDSQPTTEQLTADSGSSEPCLHVATEAAAADMVLDGPFFDAFLQRGQPDAEDFSLLDGCQSEDLYWPLFDTSLT